MTSIDDTADFMNQFNKAAEEQEQESDYDVNNGNGKFKVAEAKKKTKVQLKSKSEQVQREEKEHEERIAAIAKSVSSFEEWQTKLVEKYQTLYNVVQKNLPNLWHSLEFDLSSALKEREWIREFAETKGLDFYVNSTYQDVIKTLETGGIDLLHFSTHSRFHEMPNLSSIVLENEIEFRPQQIIGKTTKFGQTNPMVIMNTGQGAIQAWAAKFIRQGVSACIGPMWDINDETAFRFTKELYTQLSTGRVSVGEAVRRARNYCRQFGDLSWLSYVMYGHPNSTIKIGS